MLESRKRLGLLFKAANELGCGETVFEDLQRDDPARLNLFRLINGTHAAFSDQPKNPVGTKRHGGSQKFLIIEGVRAGDDS